MVNLLAKGEAPLCLAPFLAGASLTALPKEDGSVRPIAVGGCWRRLVGKTLCKAYQEQARSILWPLQIGVAQPLGTEVGLQAARQWFERHSQDPEAVFLKVDFSNAFNSVDRSAFLEQCRNELPGLSRWAEWCYKQPSQLLFGSSTFSSEVGVQQGDPIGPLLFSLALQPILRKIAARRSQNGLQLVFSYLDDCCLAGHYQAVADALVELKTECSKIGLEFSPDKCELIPTAGLNSTVTLDAFPANQPLKVISNQGFKLLGGPIGTPAFCEAHTKKRVEKGDESLRSSGRTSGPTGCINLAPSVRLVWKARVFCTGRPTKQPPRCPRSFRHRRT